MTTIKDFLFEKIGQLSRQFPSARFRYGFDRLAEAHIIEVNPESVLEGQLGDLLWDVEIEAANSFPYDLMTVIDENSRLFLESVEQEWVGKTFKPNLLIPTIADRSLVANVMFLNTDAFSHLIQPLLGAYIADWNLSESETQSVSGASISLVSTKSPGIITASPDETPETTRSGNTQYAMAA